MDRFGCMGASQSDPSASGRARPDQSHIVQARLDHEDEVGATSNASMQLRVAELEARIEAALATRQRGFFLQNGLQVDTCCSWGQQDWLLAQSSAAVALGQLCYER